MHTLKENKIATPERMIPVSRCHTIEMHMIKGNMISGALTQNIVNCTFAAGLCMSLARLTFMSQY